MKAFIGLVVLTGIVTAVSLGTKKICEYVKCNQTSFNELKHDVHRWQDLYYEKLTQDDIAWG